MNLNKKKYVYIINSTIMIKVTDSAKAQLEQELSKSGKPDSSFVRVGVKSGGCSGLSYVLEFDDKLKDGDQKFEDKGIKIVVDKKSFLYLVGTELDYSGGLNGTGFTFVNPNSTRTCGCGESFSV